MSVDKKVHKDKLNVKIEEDSIKNSDVGENINSDENNIKDSSKEEIIIYKKEKNPFVKITLWLVGAIALYCVIVFAIGFIIGLNGLRPPTVDSHAIQNEWNQMTDQTPPPDNTSELDKVKDQ